MAKSLVGQRGKEETFLFAAPSVKLKPEVKKRKRNILSEISNHIEKNAKKFTQIPFWDLHFPRYRLKVTWFFSVILQLTLNHSFIEVDNNVLE